MQGTPDHSPQVLKVFDLVSTLKRNKANMDTVIFSLSTQDVKFKSQKFSLTPVSYYSSDIPVMLLGTLMMMLYHTGGILYLPPSL